MRIKELKVNNWEVIRQADLLDLSDFVVIAGPNGVGKTKIKNSIVHIFQNNGNPPAGSSVILEATSKQERDTWKTEEFSLPQNQFWSFLTTNNKRLKSKSRLIQIDSNRVVDSIKFQNLSFNQIGDPENEDVGYDYGFNNVKDRFSDICRTLHRLKSKEVTSVYKEYNTQIDPAIADVTLKRLKDPTEKYIQLFGDLLYPKTMEPIDINSTTIQYKDEDGTVRNFNSLSSGEKEVVVLTFDILTQNPTDCIILIDEPEVHLHPELTFRLVKVLKSIGQRNQFFLFTHSPDIIGNSLDSGVHFIRPKSNTSGNQVIKVDSENLSGFQNIPNIRETIGMVSVGKKLLFVEGNSTSIDRDVFATIAKAYKTDVAIIPSDSCSNINNMSLICDTLNKGVFGIELHMIRDRDGLTEDQIQNFTTKSNGRLNFLPYYHIENIFLVPEAIEVVAKKILLNKAPSLDEIKEKLVSYAKNQINQTAILYVKSEIYFQAGNFDISPKITVTNSTSIEEIKTDMASKRDELLQKYATDFNDQILEDRLKYWKTKLEDSIKTGWTEEAKKYFIGKRLLKDVQNSLFGTKNISLWEHILNSEEQECKLAIKPLEELIEKI